MLGKTLEICAYAKNEQSGLTTPTNCIQWQTQFIAVITGEVSPPSSQIQVDDVQIIISVYFPNGTDTGLRFETSTGVGQTSYSIRIVIDSLPFAAYEFRVTAFKMELDGFMHVFSWGYGEDSHTCSSAVCPANSNCCQKSVGAFTTASVNLYDMSAITITGAVQISYSSNSFTTSPSYTGSTTYSETQIYCGSEGSVVMATLYQGGVAQTSTWKSEPICTPDGAYTIVIPYGSTVLLSVLPPQNLTVTGNLTRHYAYMLNSAPELPGDPTQAPFAVFRNVENVKFQDNTKADLQFNLYGGDTECGILIPSAIQISSPMCQGAGGVMEQLFPMNTLQSFPSLPIQASWVSTTNALQCLSHSYQKLLASNYDDCINIEKSVTNNFLAATVDLRTAAYSTFSWNYYSIPTASPSVYESASTIPIPRYVAPPQGGSAYYAFTSYYVVNYLASADITFHVTEQYGTAVCNKVEASAKIEDEVTNSGSACSNDATKCVSVVPITVVNSGDSSYNSFFQHTVTANNFGIKSSTNPLPLPSGQTVQQPPYSVFLMYSISSKGTILPAGPYYVFFAVTGHQQETSVSQAMVLPSYPPYTVLYDPPGN